MAKSLYLLGAGGHGRVLLDALQASGVQVTGILDPGLEVGQRIYDIPVLGGDRVLESIDPATCHLVNGIGANPSIASRRQLFIKWSSQGYTFSSVIHPTAIISKQTNIAESCQIMAGAIVQAGVTLGQDVVVNTRASVDHDCVVADHCFISPGAILCGNITLEQSTFIGAGAVTLPGLHIGANSIIGAGTVVPKTIPRHWIVAGSPAQKVGVNTQHD
ncbi:acetyltransferase [Candidatus Synechococcus calcipolaris G9]|uniref:Acetyltransferase n=1 Tax=Candidatus Synechococcus calcipolaris G9 TaxID=1497997 RepID=A0ABT6F3E5_9SYNE|nr:acetyltransferase [Candidatus Synechococcus calcipolaris]MDG2992388.1 acetyltransferase [Candidatus Synechococcus calcipolaris G9]